MTEDGRQPFSEEAAIRELEALQKAIEQSRARRKDANDAFDRFLRSFDRHVAPPPVPEPERRPPMPPPPVDFMPPAPPPRPAPPPAPLPAPPAPPAVLAPTPATPPGPVRETKPVPEPALEETVVPVAPPNVAEPPSDVTTEETLPIGVRAAPAHQPPLPVPLEPRRPPLDDDGLNLDVWEERSPPTVATAAFPTEAEVPALGTSAPSTANRLVPAALTSAAARSGPRFSPVLAVIAVIVVGSVAFFLLRTGTGDDGASSDQQAAETSAAQPQPAPAPPAAAAPPPQPVNPPFAEVSTVRRAWVRVVIDGRKVLERELPPDSHIPLEPGSQIVVRAGDAGAVRVAVGGKDQGAVGRDGEVATKTFTVAAKPVR